MSIYLDRLSKLKGILYLVLALIPLRHVEALSTPANPIYVDTFATAGDGTQSSPWTGWDSTIL